MENNAVKYGIYSGVASVLFSMVLYFINPSLMFGMAAWIGLLIPVYFMYKAATEEKMENDGYLSFGEALKATFLVAVIAFLISTLYSYVLINFIDPSLVDTIKQQSVEAAEKVAGMFGGDEDVLEEMRDQMDEQNFAPTLASSLMSYLFTLIIPGFPMALIVSAITKKNNENMA